MSWVLHPGRWPVRWRLAAASAGLTLAILVIFAGVIGHLASQRIRDDFNRELKGAVRTLANEVRIEDTPTNSLITKSPFLDDYVLPNDATARIFDANGVLRAPTPMQRTWGRPCPESARWAA